MTPKDKAKELTSKFTKFIHIGYSEEITPDTYNSKKDAIICVNEILEIVGLHKLQVAYWNKVKEEIELL